MKAGDLVSDISILSETGIVIRRISTVEIPPLIEVFWSDGVVSRCYSDELVHVCIKKNKAIST